MKTIRVNSTQFRLWRQSKMILVDPKWAPQRSLTTKESEVVSSHIARAKKLCKSVEIALGEDLKLTVKAVKYGYTKESIAFHPMVNGLKVVTNREIIERFFTQKHKCDCMIKGPNGKNIKIARYAPIEADGISAVDVSLHDPKECPQCVEWEGNDSVTHDSTCQYAQAWEKRNRKAEYLIEVSGEGRKIRAATFAECLQADAQEKSNGTRIIKVSGVNFAIMADNDEEPTQQIHAVNNQISAHQQKLAENAHEEVEELYQALSPGTRTAAAFVKEEAPQPNISEHETEKSEARKAENSELEDALNPSISSPEGPPSGPPEGIHND